MPKLAFLVAIFALFPIASTCQHRTRKSTEIFEATVVRVEPKMLMSLSCGVAIVYRLAEYRVESASRGHLHKGDDIVVRHLACNGNELDDLSAGDKVIVFARKLPKPEKSEWPTYKPGAPKPVVCPDPNTQNCTETPFLPGDNVTILYDADRLAKLVYPTTPRPAR